MCLVGYGRISGAWGIYVPRLTGRWAISWQVIVFANALTYPQMVLTGGTLGSRQITPEDLPTSAAVMGVAVLANAAYGLLAMATVFRNRARNPVPLSLYLGFYLSAGIIPVLGMEYLDSILGKQTALPVGLRLFFACLTTLWLGVIFSLLLEGRERFRQSRAQLLEEAIELQRAAFEESEAGLELRRSVDEIVDKRLTEARQELDQVLVMASVTDQRPGNLEPIVAALEGTARDSVRPLSHELWDQVQAEHPRPRSSQVFRHLWHDPRFLAGNTALITAIGLPGASVRGFGAWAPVAISLLTLTVWGLLRVSNQLIGRVRSVAAKRGIFALAVLVALAVILEYSLIPGEVTTPTQDAGSIVIAFLTGIVLVSYVGALADVRRSVLESLRSEVIQAEIDSAARRSALAAVTRDVARSLHGPVQTRLVACAASIEQAQRTGDSSAIVRALDESAEAIKVIGSPQAEPDHASLGEEINRLVGNWRAVWEVDLVVSSDLAQRFDLSPVVEIVGEGIANAYRHGMASEIRVAIARSDDDIVIDVRDDGIGPTGNPPGLGRQLIAEYCGGRSSLERIDGQTVFTAMLADRT